MSMHGFLCSSRTMNLVTKAEKYFVLDINCVAFAFRCLFYLCSVCYPCRSDDADRMHPEISRFPSLHFYNSKLKNGGNVQQEEVYTMPYHASQFFKPYTFFDVQSLEVCFWCPSPLVFVLFLAVFGQSRVAPCDRSKWSNWHANTVDLAYSVTRKSKWHIRTMPYHSSQFFKPYTFFDVQSLEV